MTIFSLVASHQTVNLTTIAQISQALAESPDQLADCGLAGEVLLSTCNRIEIYGQVQADSPQPSQEIDRVRQQIIQKLAQQTSLDTQELEQAFTLRTGQQAAHHLLTVAAGLESAIVGEREITGQVRRALAQAQDKGRASSQLVRLFEQGAQTAKKVGQQTSLGSQGRSLVSLALDMAHQQLPGSWQQRRVLVIGTGAYAGASLAALQERGCQDIWVYSHSDRAVSFAHKRGVQPVAPDQLYQQLEAADLVLGCSGSGTPLTPQEIPPGPRLIIDLALTRDFAPEVADLPQVRLLSLDEIRLAAPQEAGQDLSFARTIVDEAARDYQLKEEARQLDTAIVSLRQHSQQILEEQLAKVKSQNLPESQELEKAMRQLVQALLHTPTVRARQLARAGQAQDYLAGLQALYGLDPSQPPAQTSQHDHQPTNFPSGDRP